MTVDSEPNAIDPVVATARTDGARKTVAFVVCILAAGAFLVSGIGIVVMMLLTAKPGMESALVIAKTLSVAGWLVIAAWLSFEVRHLRFRVLVPLALGWYWAVFFLIKVGDIGYVPYGV